MCTSRGGELICGRYEIIGNLANLVRLEELPKDPGARSGNVAQPWKTAHVLFKHEDEGAGPKMAADFLGRLS